MKKGFFLLLVFMLIATGCSNNRVVVKGEFSNGTSNGVIYLTKIEINEFLLTDSAKIKNNSFQFKLKVDEPSFYQIGFSSEEFVTVLVAPGEKVNLKFKNKIPNSGYTVEGSEGSAQIQRLDQKLYATKVELDSLMEVYSEALRLEGDDDALAPIEKQYEDAIKAQRLNNIEFIISNPSSFASIVALYQRYDDGSYVLYSNKDLQYIMIVADSLSNYYPDSKLVMSLATDINREKQLLLSRQLEEIISNAEETKLDPNLLDQYGKRVALSSLRGKYVLLSFYSYASESCVAENILLKEYYKNYKNRGFEIYQINLDQDEALWKNYIDFEEIPWISVREDDPTNLVNARLFNIQSLPANYLFDKEGNIIASNLHDRNLKIKLEQIFN